MPDLGVPELLIIAFIVILLFGSKKLPDAARSVGRSLRIFKAETKGLREDADDEATPPTRQRALDATSSNGQPAPAAPPPVAQAPPPVPPAEQVGQPQQVQQAPQASPYQPLDPERR